MILRPSETRSDQCRVVLFLSFTELCDLEKELEKLVLTHSANVEVAYLQVNNAIRVLEGEGEEE